MYATILNGEIFEMFETEAEAKKVASIMRRNKEDYDSTDRITVRKLY